MKKLSETCQQCVGHAITRGHDVVCLDPKRFWEFLERGVMELFERGLECRQLDATIDVLTSQEEAINAYIDQVEVDVAKWNDYLLNLRSEEIHEEWKAYLKYRKSEVGK